MSGRTFLGPALLALSISSCLPGQPAGTDVSAPSPTATGPAVSETCQQADQALIDRLDGALQVRGAYVSNLYVARASDLAGASLGLADPWWAAGRINGVGVRPEAGAWIWDAAAPGPGSTVLSTNASAARYFSFANADPQLASRSSVVAALLDCVGPMPQP